MLSGTPHQGRGTIFSTPFYGSWYENYSGEMLRRGREHRTVQPFECSVFA